MIDTMLEAIAAPSAFNTIIIIVSPIQLKGRFNRLQHTTVRRSEHGKKDWRKLSSGAGLGGGIHYRHRTPIRVRALPSVKALRGQG